MPNDDLGQFPTPQAAPANPPAPVTTPEPTLSASNNIVPEFETTPDEVPSPTLTPPTTSTPAYTEAPPPPEPGSPFIVTSPEPTPEPVQVAPPEPAQPILAVAPTNTGSSFRTIIFAVLFFTALGGLAGSAFLYQQTTQLRGQMAEITQILNQQRTQPATTPTPTIIEIPSGAPTPSVIAIPTATISATPSPTVIPVTGSALKPLSVASNILKIGIDYQPNAQFILLKTDNVNDSQNTITKYFFRQDLNTKKYFYVLVSGNSQPEIIDKNIQVTPDNNIPSLNNLVLENKLGIDLDEALKITHSKCSDLAVCQSADTKAQFIQIQNRAIWQISLFVPGATQPMVMQINAQTKEIIFRTSDFLPN